MLARIVFAAMMLIILDPARSFGQPRVLSITAPPAIQFTVCPLSSCPDFAERFRTCDCDLAENLIRHPVFSRYLIPQHPKQIDYIFTRW